MDPYFIIQDETRSAVGVTIVRRSDMRVMCIAAETYAQVVLDALNASAEE